MPTAMAAPITLPPGGVLGQSLPLPLSPRVGTRELLPKSRLERTESPVRSIRKSLEDVRTPTARNQLSGPGAPCNPVDHLRRESTEKLKSIPISPKSYRRESSEPAPVQSFKAGGPVEVWSNSQQVWCPGFVKKVVGNKVTAEFTLLDNAPAKKVLHIQSREIRAM